MNRRDASTMDTTVPTVGADLAFAYGYDGKGIAVAVIDSGIASDPGLIDPQTGKSRVLYSESFLDKGKPGKDKYGHGTHIAGIVAASNAQVVRMYSMSANVFLKMRARDPSRYGFSHSCLNVL